MDTELKPCPFCGEEAGICEANDICFHRDDDGNKIFGGWRCFCPSCAIEQIGYETREEAVSAWNNRSTEHATHRAPVDEKGGGRMTGIERLRRLARSQNMNNVWTAMLAHELFDIADQIDRELSVERDRWESDLYEAQVEWNRVAGVCLEMERHCLYDEDTAVRDVERWARELRHAMKSDASDECGAQNPSWHDPAEAADVTSDAPKVTLDPAADVSVSAYDLLPEEEREAIAWVREHGGLERVKKLLDWVVGHCSTRQQLDFDFWLSGRVMHELGFEEDMADRDEVERRLLARLMPDGMEWPRFESGEPVRIGDVVSDVEVRSVVFRDGGILLSDCTSVPGWGTWRSYKEPIKRPERLTHECPVAGTWERLEEDAANLDEMPCDYSAKDLVRRAKALAERDAS